MMIERTFHATRQERYPTHGGRLHYIYWPSWSVNYSQQEHIQYNRTLICRIIDRKDITAISVFKNKFNQLSYDFESIRDPFEYSQMPKFNFPNGLTIVLFCFKICQIKDFLMEMMVCLSVNSMSANYRMAFIHPILQNELVILDDIPPAPEKQERRIFDFCPDCHS